MSIELNAELRDDMGKGASRRLRRVNKVPGIVYGENKAPQTIQLEQHAVQYELKHEAFYTQVLSLNIAGKKEDVLLRDLQHHPIKQQIMHIDFLRVDAKTAVHVHVPLHFKGAENSPGVKLQGGQVSHVLSEVEVVCLPKDIPEYIEVDLSALDVGDIVHLTDLVMPAGVEILALKHGVEHDTAIANIHARKGGGDDEEETGGAAPAADATGGDKA